jgi:hypothetical protein
MDFTKFPKPKTFSEAIRHIQSGGEVWIEYDKTMDIPKDSGSCYIMSVNLINALSRATQDPAEKLSRMHLVKCETDSNDINKPTPTFKIGDEVKVVKWVKPCIGIPPELMGQKGVITHIHSRSELPICVKFDNVILERLHTYSDVFMAEELELVEYTPIEIDKEKMELLIYKRLMETCSDPDPEGVLAELVWDDYFVNQENELNDTDDLKATEVFNAILTRLSKVMLDALKTIEPQYVCTIRDPLAKTTCLGEHDFPTECIGVCDKCRMGGE